jgi:hypothetical protein
MLASAVMLGNHCLAAGERNGEVAKWISRGEEHAAKVGDRYLQFEAWLFVAKFYAAGNRFDDHIPELPSEVNIPVFKKRANRNFGDPWARTVACYPLARVSAVKYLRLGAKSVGDVRDRYVRLHQCAWCRALRGPA